MRNLTQRWPQSGYFFSKLGHFYPVSPPPHPVASLHPQRAFTCANSMKIEKGIYEVYSKLTIKTLEWLYGGEWCRPGVFIVDLRTDYIFFWYLQVIIFFYSSLDNTERLYFEETTVICKKNYFSSTIIKMLNSWKYPFYFDVFFKKQGVVTQ